MSLTVSHRRMTVALVVPLTLVLLACVGCAATFKPGARRQQDIRVTTNPTGGEVWVDGRLYGSAPLILTLDTRVPHDVTVRRANDIKSYRLKPQLSTTGGLFLAADAAVLAAGAWCAISAFEEAAQPAYDPQHPWGYRFPGLARGIGIACLVVGVPPLIYDVATNSAGEELRPTEITVEFK